MLLQMVGGIRPKNEMEAALAAQMMAVFLLQMKASSAALKGWSLDERTAVVAGKLARTYAMQTDNLNRMRGKGRSTRQKIIVTHDKHIHQHHHQHIHMEGAADFGRQACEPSTASGGQNNRSPPRKHAGSAALPGSDASGSSCQCPATKGRNRCRLHGGAAGSGAPRGEANGSYAHGGWTSEAVEFRRTAANLMRDLRGGTA